MKLPLGSRSKASDFLLLSNQFLVQIQEFLGKPILYPISTCFRLQMDFHESQREASTLLLTALSIGLHEGAHLVV